MDGNYKKKVSIIVDAYNMSATIDETLTSICNQTYNNIEIICIDDCSTDDTLQIMRRWESVDKRIKIVEHTINKGSFAAKYSGVANATGEYLLFVDAANTYEPIAVSLLEKKMEQSGADVCEFGIEVKYENNEPIQEQVYYWNNFSHLSSPGVITGNFAELCFVKKDIKTVVWNEIYKTDLMRGAVSLFNDEHIIIADDYLLTFMVLNLAQKYVRISDKLINCNAGMRVSTKEWSNDRESIVKKASAYCVCNIIADWSEQFGFDIKKISSSKKSIEEELGIIAAVQSMKMCTADACRVYIDTFSQYIDRKTFYANLIKAIYRDKLFDVREALPRIKDSRWLSNPDKRKVKTVGLFYFRLYNGGIERVISLMSDILKKAGLNVVVITEQEPNNLDYALAKGTARVVLGTIFKSEIERAEKLEQIIADYNIDAVVYNAWMSANLIPDSLAVKACGIPFIIYTHGVVDTIYRCGIRQLMPQNITYLMSDVVVTLSDVSQAWWEALGYKSIKIINPATFDVQNVVPSNLNTKDVLWVGRLSAEKQYSDAFDIADIIHSSIPDFRLRVVGSFENENDFIKLKDEMENSGRSEYIILEGYHIDIEQFYNNAAVQLCTSEREAYPMAILEGKVFGIPLVTYEIPEMDFVRYPKGTFIVRQHDCEGAAQRIIELLADSRLRESMGREARQDAERLSEINLGQKWLDIFKEATIWEEKISMSESRPIIAAVNAVLKGAFKETYYYVPPQENKPERKGLSLLMHNIYHYIVPYPIRIRIYNSLYGNNQ